MVYNRFNNNCLRKHRHESIRRYGIESAFLSGEIISVFVTCSQFRALVTRSPYTHLPRRPAQRRLSRVISWATASLLPLSFAVHFHRLEMPRKQTAEWGCLGRAQLPNYLSIFQMLLQLGTRSRSSWKRTARTRPWAARLPTPREQVYLRVIPRIRCLTPRATIFH
jgi:hypothetical protein